MWQSKFPIVALNKLDVEQLYWRFFALLSKINPRHMISRTYELMYSVNNPLTDNAIAPKMVF